MERTAWFCPSCQRHHAPHVETCPATNISTGLPMPVFQPKHPTTRTPSTRTPSDPKRGIVTYAGDGGTVWGPQ